MMPKSQPHAFPCLPYGLHSAAISRRLLGFAGAFALGGAAFAELTVPAIIASGMVLQQQAAVPLWGTAAPGATVQVAAEWSEGRTTVAEAVADAEGRWTARLDTPQASTDPASITIRTGDETIELEDVLVGEVWLCSGQSNMVWELEHIVEAARKSGELPPSKTSLEPANIRHFTVPRSLALEPQTVGGGKWLDASGSDALGCSAVAYFFAQRIQEDLGVPIGLIVSAWGGTPAESWVPEKVVAAFPDHAKALADVRANDGVTTVSAAQVAEFWDAADDEAYFARRFRTAEFDDSHWDRTAVPTSFGSIGLGNFNGVVWFRTEVDVPPSWKGQDLELQLPPLDDVDETLWNGKRVGSEVAVGAWSIKRRYTIPASDVTAGRASLTIRILDTGGYGGFGSGEMRLVKGDEWIELAGEWRYRKGVTAEQAGTPPRPPQLKQHTPSALFNAMISPLRPFGVRGVLWYQGESNRERPTEYRHLFPALIVDWRTQWDNMELPFYYVQIAPYDYDLEPEEIGSVAQLREAQAIAAKLPRTGMALTADIGNPKNIHPKNKWEVGRRLALFALRDLYAQGDLEPNGPTFRDARVEGATLVLGFDHVAGRLHGTSDEGGLEHFELQASDGRFVPATATISADGQSVLLQAADVTSPTGARYLWSDRAESTLAGGTGLPVAPFRTTK